jgi:hypothetical protein
MTSRTLLGSLGGSVSPFFFALTLAPLAHAQCSKDTDCKGDRVCEEGACVAPPPAGPADAAPPPPPNPQGEAARAPAYAPPLAAPPNSSSEGAIQGEPKPVMMRRHSTGMMAGGIVMVSFVPVALLAAWVADLEQGSCQGDSIFSIDGSESRGTGTNCGRFDATIYGGLISAAVLAGVGIPLIVIGAKKEPAGFARFTPWATPHSVGLGLRVDL